MKNLLKINKRHFIENYLKYIRMRSRINMIENIKKFECLNGHCMGTYCQTDNPTKTKLVLHIENEIYRVYAINFIGIFENIHLGNKSDKFIYKKLKQIMAKIEESMRQVSIHCESEDFFIGGKIFSFRKSKHGKMIETGCLLVNNILSRNDFCVFEADPSSYDEITCTGDSYTNHMISNYKMAVNFIANKFNF
ncbi:hypothetical protein MHBO_001500 [Bonamia ostreae]|uniref:Uncharacterized protein n=1 Tax=Bonamia ostreae TaxID=126728 RepID=A0ABV2AK16_9EUKA